MQAMRSQLQAAEQQALAHQAACNQLQGEVDALRTSADTCAALQQQVADQQAEKEQVCRSRTLQLSCLTSA
jgi:hypothetical protein